MNSDRAAPLILIVEDEPRLGQLLVDYLQADNFRTHHLLRGDEVISWVNQHTPDLIILDLMLPGMDGLSVCRELRRQGKGLPVMMVTAKTEEIDRLLGLEIGADDYLCKPFSPREAVARVKTILRRCLPAAQPVAEGAQLVINQSRVQASWNNQPLELTPAEFRLLRALALQPDTVSSREQLMNLLYDDYRVVTDRTIDSHIKNLRRKLEALDADRPFIRTVYGMGYRWEAGVCKLI